MKAALTATERKNLAAFGYGVKSFGLSMVEAAVTISGGRVPSTVVAEMVEMVRGQLEEPVRLLEHVPEVLAEVGATRRLILITKGDLIHQTHKVTTSGLAHHFEHVEIVLEKDPETYARVLHGSCASTRRGSAWSATACAATSCPCWRSAATACTCRTRCCGTSSSVDHDAALRRAGLARRPPRLARRPLDPLYRRRRETSVTRWSGPLRSSRAARDLVGSMFSRRFLPLISCQMNLATSTASSCDRSAK